MKIVTRGRLPNNLPNPQTESVSETKLMAHPAPDITSPTLWYMLRFQLKHPKTFFKVPQIISVDK